MTRDEYVQALQDLLSRDPARVRDANRRLYDDVVESAATDPAEVTQPGRRTREADLVLAEVAA